MSQPVAFIAVLVHDVTLGPHQAVEFEKVMTNIGNAYDSRDGQFTVPVYGLYVSSALICSQQSSNAHIEIVRNAVQLAAIYGDDYNLGSQTIMVQFGFNISLIRDLDISIMKPIEVTLHLREHKLSH